MPLLISKQSEPLFFIHIPKTAGTSLKSMLKSDVEIMFNTEFKQELPCPPQHFHYELLDRLGMFKIAKKHVAVTRNPIKRFISEYAYRQKVDPKFRFMSLTAFAYFVTKIYKHNPYILSNHIRPQTSFIGKNTLIYRLEDGLDKLIGGFPEYFEANLEKAVIKNTSNSDGNFIDPRTLNLVATFYKADLEQLEYEAESVETKAEPFFQHVTSVLVGYLVYYLYRIVNRK